MMNETAAATEAILQDSPHQDEEFNWEEQQQVCNDASETSVQQCIDNAIWMYHNQPPPGHDESPDDDDEDDGDEDEQPNYSEDLESSVVAAAAAATSIKTDLNETEIDDNFASNEVVIAQTDPDGTLHFENYNYDDAAQDTAVYTEAEPMQFDCDDDDDDDAVLANLKQEAETVVEYQECSEDYGDEMMEPMFADTDKPEEPEQPDANNVFVLDSEQFITPHIENSDIKELLATSNSSQTTEDIIHVDAAAAAACSDEQQQPVKIIPCQLKVCNGNGSAVQFLKNSKIALLGNKAQSINFMQNGKKHTFLLLASGDNSVLEVDSSGIVEGSKSLPVIAVPAE